MAKNFTVIENDKTYGWCLFRVVNVENEEKANAVLEQLKIENPNKELKLDSVEDKDAWWK